MHTATIELDPSVFPPEFFNLVRYFMPDMSFRSIVPADPANQAWEFSCDEPGHFYALGWLHAQFRPEGLEHLRAGAEAQGFDLSLVETALQAEKEVKNG